MGAQDEVPTVSDLKQPMGVLGRAIKQVPATRYALAVAGVAGAAAMVRLFVGGDLNKGLLVLSVMFVLVVAMLVFAKMTTLSERAFRYPAMVLLWSFVVFFIVSGALALSSVFFGRPLKWQPVAGAATEGAQSHAPVEAGPQPLPEIGEYACLIEGSPTAHCFVEGQGDGARFLRFDANGHRASGVVHQISGILRPQGECVHAQLSRTFGTDDEKPIESDAGAVDLCRSSSRWEGSWQATSRMRFVLAPKAE